MVRTLKSGTRRRQGRHIRSRKIARPKLRNWLLEMDRAVQKLPRAETAGDYWNFFFVRYPHLRPSPYRTRLQGLREQIARYEAIISNDQETRRTLDTLSRALRKQLAALVLDTIGDLDDLSEKKDLKRIGRIYGSQRRNLIRKVEKLRGHLEDVRRDALKLHHYLGRDVAVRSLRCLEIISECRIPASDLIEIIPVHYSKVRLASRTAMNMVKLYWFFRYGCEVDGDEAEVRVALIRNRFWTPYVPKIPYQGAYDGTENKNCPAVHQAILRYSR